MTSSPEDPTDIIFNPNHHIGNDVGVDFERRIERLPVDIHAFRERHRPGNPDAVVDFHDGVVTGAVSQPVRASSDNATTATVLYGQDDSAELSQTLVYREGDLLRPDETGELQPVEPTLEGVQLASFMSLALSVI